MYATDTINLDSISNSASSIRTVSNSLIDQKNDIVSTLNSVDQRVLSRISTDSFDTLANSSDRLSTASSVLTEVANTYQLSEDDLDNDLTWDMLELIYPEFKDLCDERKAIIIAAFKYLNLKRNDVYAYASNYKSEYGVQISYADYAWCAHFVGSILSYFWGNGNLIPTSYASVYKIIGLYNGDKGLAFTSDPRISFYMSQAYVAEYNNHRNTDGSCGLSNWNAAIARFNSTYDRNKEVSDWIDEDFIPQAGDIVVFNGANNPANINSLFPGGNSYTHIGFVLGVREVNGELYIDTLEGNVYNDVQVRSFKADDPYLYGFASVKYEEFGDCLDTNALNSELSTGIDTNRSGAVVGSVTSKLKGFDVSNVGGDAVVRGTSSSVVSLADVFNDAAKGKTTHISTGSTSTGSTSTGSTSTGSTSTGSTSTGSTSTGSTSNDNSFSENVDQITNNDNNSNNPGSNKPTEDSTNENETPANSDETSNTPSNDVVVTPIDPNRNALPPDPRSIEVPNLPYGKCQSYEVVDNHSGYLLSDITDDNVKDYIKVLEDKNYSLVDNLENTYRNDKYIISFKRQEDGLLNILIYDIGLE